MKEYKNLLEKYGCDNLSQFIDNWLDHDIAYDEFMNLFHIIDSLNNRLDQLNSLCLAYSHFLDFFKSFISEEISKK